MTTSTSILTRGDDALAALVDRVLAAPAIEDYIARYQDAAIRADPDVDAAELNRVGMCAVGAWESDTELTAPIDADDIVAAQTGSVIDARIEERAMQETHDDLNRSWR